MGVVLLCHLCVFLGALSGAHALSFPTFYASNMVVQYTKPCFNGWSGSGDTVFLSFNKKEYNTTTAPSGEWSLCLPKQPPGGPHSLHFHSSHSSNLVVFENVLFGDVYLCSGQSNMEFTTSMAVNASEEIADSINYPLLRLFTVARNTSKAPLDDVESQASYAWGVSSPSTVGGEEWEYFSAVCYFFGRDIHISQKIPIGLVSSAWGGTTIEAWSSAEALDQCEQPPPSDRAQRVGKCASVAYVNDDDRNVPMGLWNGMIHPLRHVSFAGVVWYQGEANMWAPTYYRCQFAALITDWRKKLVWGREDGVLPFLYVEIAPTVGGGGFYCRIRDAQHSVNTLPSVGMATAVDLGDTDSQYCPIHPRFKQPVSARLALLARDIVYGEKAVDSGPVLKGVRAGTVAPNATTYNLTLTFSSAANMTWGNTSECESCCASGVITVLMSDGSTVDRYPLPTATPSDYVLTLEKEERGGEVVAASAVYYAWSDYPECALYNSRGLAAAPFFHSLRDVGDAEEFCT